MCHPVTRRVQFGPVGQFAGRPKDSMPGNWRTCIGDVYSIRAVGAESGRVGLSRPLRHHTHIHEDSEHPLAASLGDWRPEAGAVLAEGGAGALRPAMRPSPDARRLVNRWLLVVAAAIAALAILAVQQTALAQ